MGRSIGVAACRAGEAAARSEIPRSRKRLEAAIVRLLRLGRETAAGQLPAGEVILDAVTADALLRARCVGACALLQIPVLFAFHA